jgi:hypothetical protein
MTDAKKKEAPDHFWNPADKRRRVGKVVTLTATNVRKDVVEVPEEVGRQRSWDADMCATGRSVLTANAVISNGRTEDPQCRTQWSLIEGHYVTGDQLRPDRVLLRIHQTMEPVAVLLPHPGQRFLKGHVESSPLLQSDTH